MTNKQKDTSGSRMRRSSANKGQVMLEFTFCMIVIMIMIFGITKVFFWTGNDLATRRISHDDRLLLISHRDHDAALFDRLYVLIALNVPPIPGIPRFSEALSLMQIDPLYHIPVKMNAIWDGL